MLPVLVIPYAFLLLSPTFCFKDMDGLQSKHLLWDLEDKNAVLMLFSASVAKLIALRRREEKQFGPSHFFRCKLHYI